MKFELLLPRTNEFGSMNARKDDILPQNTPKRPLKAIQDHTMSQNATHAHGRKRRRNAH